MFTTTQQECNKFFCIVAGCLLMWGIFVGPFWTWCNEAHEKKSELAAIADLRKVYGESSEGSSTHSSMSMRGPTHAEACALTWREHNSTQMLY
eukprot:5676345-Amphidinium_carterae.2